MIWSQPEMLRPIYPFPLKPASGIRTWTDWPEDVVEILKWWNGGYRGLSFWGHRVFKCPDCNQFCEPQMYGNATIDKVSFCDDCIIARARRALVKLETIEILGRPADCGSCICDATLDVIRPECTYHRAAAANPNNHSIPWNCPTYWDGCNCTKPQNCGPPSRSS
jgi:hypothetical protein